MKRWDDRRIHLPLKLSQCKYIKQETTGVKCPRPGCGGELVEEITPRQSFLWLRELSQVRIGFLDKPIEEKYPQRGAFAISWLCIITQEGVITR